jgi:ribonuclease-3
VTDDGPDHDKRFHAAVVAAGKRHGPATGTSKKRAEQAAALLACTALESLESSSPALVPVGAPLAPPSRPTP